jgi:hypothetical protein
MKSLKMLSVAILKAAIPSFSFQNDIMLSVTMQIINMNRKYAESHIIECCYNKRLVDLFSNCLFQSK